MSEVILNKFQQSKNVKLIPHKCATFHMINYTKALKILFKKILNACVYYRLYYIILRFPLNSE